MEKHNPVLVLEFGGLNKKKGKGSDKEDMQKEALVESAKLVKEAVKADDDEKLALALMDFVELCSSIGWDDSEEESEESGY